MEEKITNGMDTSIDLEALKEDAIRYQQEQKEAQNNQSVENTDVNEEHVEPKEYKGPGLVIDKGDIKEEEITRPSYTGITPDTQSSIDDYMRDYDERIESAKQEVEELKAIQEETSEEDEEEGSNNNMTRDEFMDKYNEAVIVIDKTDYGKVIDFTDDERKKLEQVKTIKLDEIETVSLESIKTKKINKKKTDIGKIIERRANMNITNIVLPYSGYTAQIKGCSALELVSLIDGNQNALLDQQMKWSLIHSKLENTSIGKMSFNEFLLNTASQDYNSFIYGIICSTYPDDDSFTMKCEKCGASFEHKYSIRSLIRAEKMSDELQDTIMRIVDSSCSEVTAKEVHDASPVCTVKRMRLPYSGCIVEIYAQSAYDLINKSIKELSNQDPKYQQASVLSTVVKCIYVPDDEDADGSYYEVDSAEDIVKLIYSLPGRDVMIINKQAEKMFNMNIEYGFMDINCPKCNHFIPSQPQELDGLLFYKYRQELNTKIE